jgi:peptidyl-prolyl cis-trans isomerase D
VSIAEISRERVGAPPEPTEAQVKAFYDENQAQLATPEMRDLTVVRAAPQLFLAKVTVPEEAIKQAFEFKKNELASVERRSFVQISTGSRDAAAEAARQLAAGGDPRKIAQAVRGQAIPIANEGIRDVPDAGVAETVFKLQRGQVAGPIQSSINGVWAAARLVDITPAGTVSYEKVRDQIGQQLAIEQAKTLMGDAVDKFEQERSGGKDMEAAAQAAGLAVIKLERVLAQGVRDGGGPAPGLADVPELLRAAFLTSQGEATDFMPTPDEGYALVRVDKVIAPGVRPYEAVKPVLIAGWKNRETNNAMQALVKQVQDQVSDGKPFTEVVKALNLRLVGTEETVDRRSIQEGGAPALVAQIFGAKEKDVVAGPDASNRVLLVAQVDRIRREDPSRDAARFAAANQAALQMLTGDTLNSLINGAKTSAKVKPNAKLIASQIGIDAASGKPIEKDDQ